MSDFKQLRADYIALAGKNPPPMSADALRLKVEELKAAVAAQQPAGDGDAESKAAAEKEAAEQAVAEAKAAAEKEAADRAVAEQQAAAAKEAADRAAAEAAAPSAGGDPVPQEDEPEQSLEEACAELGIDPAADAVALVLLCSHAGAECKNVGDEHICDAAEAVRMIRAGNAKLAA